MAFSVDRSEESEWVSFGIYKPTAGNDIEDAVAHVRSLVAGAGNLRAIILKSVNGSWVAVFTACKLGASTCSGLSYLGNNNKCCGEDSVGGVVRVVEGGCFQLIDEEHRDDFGRLSVGDIVSVRRIYTDLENQEVFAYSCVAVQKAYFGQMEGLLSYAFYKSKDGKLIVGLGIWDGAHNAAAPLDPKRGSPGEAYWKDLGADNLKYEVCQVVYITKEKQPIQIVGRESQRPPEFQR